MRRKMIHGLLVALMLVTLCLGAIAQGDDEEVSITIYDADGKAIAGEGAAAEGDGESGQPGEPAEPQPTVDISAPVYQADGSILLTMTFTGDMTIGSNVQSSSVSIFEKELKKQGGDLNFPFRNVRDILLADDLTMVNFEGTLTTAKRNPDKADYSFLFRADPSYASMLPQGGVDTVSFENNHADDMGAEGLAETKRVLTEAGITYASEGEPAIMTVRGAKVGSLAYQTFGGRHDEILERLPGDIAQLRSQGCDVVIVSYHWGDEEDYYPNSKQVKLGRATVDAGADLVVGHHSHRINPIEYYNGKYICYSLGNFSFAGNNKPKDMSTFLFQIKMRVKDGAATSEQFRIIPCRISSRTDYNDFAPTPYAKDTNVEAVLRVLRENGRRLDYAVEEYPLKWIGED